MPVEAANREETGASLNRGQSEETSAASAFGSDTLMTLNTHNPTTFDSATVVWPV
jgi:hypothetical protein